MRCPKVLAAVFSIGFSLSGTAIRGAAAGEDKPKTPEEAVARARPLLDEAIQAPVGRADAGEQRRINRNITDALDLLKAHSKAGFGQAPFRAIWNEAVSLGHYHGAKGIPAYRMEPLEIDNVSAKIRLGVPAGRGWALNAPRVSPREQLRGELTRTLPNGRVVRRIKVWQYFVDTVYSGVHADNAKALAEASMGGDRESMKKVTFRSNRVVGARLSKGFPKAFYYEILGEHGEWGPIRIRNYYCRAYTVTYAFEVTELRKTGADDDGWTRWQTEGEPRELDAILETLEEVKVEKK